MRVKFKIIKGNVSHKAKTSASTPSYRLKFNSISYTIDKLQFFVTTGMLPTTKVNSVKYPVSM